MQITRQRIPWVRIVSGAILGIVMLCLIVVGLVTTGWYHIHADVEVFSVDQYYGLYEVEMDLAGMSETMKYSEIEDMAEEELDLVSVAQVTRGLLYIALAFTIVFIIVAFIGATGWMSMLNGWVPVIFGVIAALFVLIAAAYFAVAFPAEATEDMPTEEEVPYDDHLDVSWYLVVIGALLGFAGSSLAKAPPRAQRTMPPRYGPHY